jgi:hypothetical protein
MFGRIKVEVQQDGSTFHERAKEDVRSEKIALPDLFADRPSNTNLRF